MNEKSEIKSILMIDDDREDFELLSYALDEVSTEVKMQFLDRFENINQFKDQPIDLVFLDINMPKCDGFEWLKGIRKSGYDKPIIMFSNSSSPKHITKAYEEGADIYFTKPDSFTGLIEGMRKLLNLNWNDREAIAKSINMQPFKI